MAVIDDLKISFLCGENWRTPQQRGHCAAYAGDSIPPKNPNQSCKKVIRHENGVQNRYSVVRLPSNVENYYCRAESEATIALFNSRGCYARQVGWIDPKRLVEDPFE
jgi:hypothetical protein